MTSGTGATTTSRLGRVAPAGPNASVTTRARLNEWLDRQSRQLFIAPAVIIILIFSVFPTIASLVLAFSNIRLRAGSYQVQFVGLRNFRKQFFGTEQFHFLGTFTSISLLGWIVTIASAASLIWWLYRYAKRDFTILGFIGRLITASMGFGLALLFSATLFSGNPFGTLGVTIFYVIVGCTIQFLIGLGLAVLCAQPIKGRTFFRVVFFIPLMITPIGIGYSFRMLADTTKGPFSPIWQWIGLGDFGWANHAWTARLFIVIGDSWQWIPFIFVILLAALENVSRDQVEAGQVDGASGWQVFKEITWPQIAPVAATVMLIRIIEAFKLVDLPNIMTSGGPGIATESMTLHSFFAWRALNLGDSAAIAYLLLFVTVVLCVSFFNLLVLKRLRPA
ncbi:carbohydrate ABC transporter permease [Mesorhizobium wenxiniae]|uniref:ABC transporter permease n=1 Tax=Mesorhizobium wenxiniae TaxID=2014805 RepID=A0A271KCA6_9HYPH|nr:sugar ABC transporter permease [Mesorhizobium wenxiniae]PAP93422.1 ABC transporter permease [Mesorhizobium wenxiniae]